MFGHRAPQAITEAVAATWHHHYGSSRMEIPLGLVGMVMLMSPQAIPATPVEGADRSILALFTELRRYGWLQHPHLWDMAKPITDWLDDEPSDDIVRAVNACVRVALQRRIQYAKGTGNDMMSLLIMELRHSADRKWRGEYHTPPEVCAMMARLAIQELPPKGARFGEPTGGSGGMFRAVAERIEDLGGCPGDYVWHLADIDRLAVACAAINAQVWNLGSYVYLWCGDTLAQGDTFERAQQARNESMMRWAAAVAGAIPQDAILHTIGHMTTPPAEQKPALQITKTVVPTDQTVNTAAQAA